MGEPLCRLLFLHHVFKYGKNYLMGMGFFLFFFCQKSFAKCASCRIWIHRDLNLQTFCSQTRDLTSRPFHRAIKIFRLNFLYRAKI